MAPRKSRRQLTAGINVCLSPGATQACSLLQTTKQASSHPSTRDREKPASPPSPVQLCIPFSADKYVACLCRLLSDRACVFWRSNVRCSCVSAYVPHRRRSCLSTGHAVKFTRQVFFSLLLFFSKINSEHNPK